MIRSRMSALWAAATLAGMLTGLAPPGAAAATAATPLQRSSMGMAYDAARSQVVLFGGERGGRNLRDTWTWDGTVWTRRIPAHAPAPRQSMAMAYDAARGQVVLFGGVGDGLLFHDTWTWDGTDRTRRTPAHHPTKRHSLAMAYDAARGQVVLFGGIPGLRNETWTWDGTDWTERASAHAPSPRHSVGMAYDAARGQVVLFGGFNALHQGDDYLADTWTWDGTDWTERTPAHAPSPRSSMGMAYDAARGQVVLFGGLVTSKLHRDTWTWDGTDWTERTPAHAPSRRFSMGMAEDSARGQVVLLGGDRGGDELGDTWTWDGSDWDIPLKASVKLGPKSGPPGTVVMVHGSGFGGREGVVLAFIDSVLGITILGRAKTNEIGAFTAEVTIPLDATAGTQQVRVRGLGSGQARNKAFTVT